MQHPRTQDRLGQQTAHHRLSQTVEVRARGNLSREFAPRPVGIGQVWRAANGSMRRVLRLLRQAPVGGDHLGGHGQAGIIGLGQ